MTILLDTLTDEQMEAVTAKGEVVTVSAGPGSGKSRTIAARIAWLIEEGVDPAEICCLTFTRAACSNIQSRVVSQVGPVANRVIIATFHEAALFLGPPLNGLRIATDAEVEAAIQSLYKGPMRRPGFRLPNKTEVYSGLHAWEAWGACNSRSAIFDTIFIVRKRLIDAGLFPLWDLIPRYFRHVGAKYYAHVLVDESQDVTPSEFGMAADLCCGYLYSVGDLRQAIMGWKMAKPESFGDPTHYLTKTFRFGDAIAQASNSLEVGPPIKGSPVVDSCVANGFELADIETYLEGDTAILTRTHSDAAAIETAYPGRVKHIQRDPLDPMCGEADRITEAASGGKIPVLTIHGAKGREWDRVIIIGPSTIKWGLASEEAEERRILYVAMTRARHELLLIHGDPEVQGWRVRANGLGVEHEG